MWILTVYSTGNTISMFEFNSETEAKEALKGVSGCRFYQRLFILTIR